MTAGWGYQHRGSAVQEGRSGVTNATTRGVEALRERIDGRVRGRWALAGRHRRLAAVLAAGAALRVIAMLGYRPTSWFNDSFDYLHVAMSPYPHAIRPDGYSFLLWLLKPFHSFALVAGIQH